MADSGVAKKRWQILAAAIKRAANKTAEDTDGAASVRRFTTFGLVHQQSVGPDSKALDDLKSALSPEELESASDFYFHGESWAQYRCDGAAKPVYVYDRKEAVTLEEMMGFNNTGNVCIWPSEEILAVYCLEHLEEFQKKSVMELGCGKGPLAGLMVAVNCDKVQRVVFTDGNEQSVANVKTSLPMNKANLGTTYVEASTLAWDRELDLSHFTSTPFDLIICADCFFFDAVREDLLLLMHKLLAPKGKVIAVAPSRSKTFEAFVDLAKAHGSFSVEVSDNYSKAIWAKHQQALKDPLYDVNLHYPLLLIMTKL